MSSLCPTCGANYCDHTDQERGQNSWESFRRPLTAEEEAVVNRVAGTGTGYDNPEKIAAAKKAHRQAVVAQEIRDIYTLTEPQLDSFFSTWTDGPAHWPVYILRIIVENDPASLHADPDKTNIKGFAIQELVNHAIKEIERA